MISVAPPSAWSGMKKEVMLLIRGLGYALIIIGVIAFVLTFLYPPTFLWVGLVSSFVALLTGIGFVGLYCQR